MNKTIKITTQCNAAKCDLTSNLDTKITSLDNIFLEIENNSAYICDYYLQTTVAGGADFAQLAHLELNSQIKPLEPRHHLIQLKPSSSDTLKLKIEPLAGLTTTTQLDHWLKVECLGLVESFANGQPDDQSKKQLQITNGRLIPGLIVIFLLGIIMLLLKRQASLSFKKSKL